METKAIVGVSLLPVYRESGIQQIRTDELLCGMMVTIKDTRDRDWYRIETTYRYSGLISKAGLITEYSNVRRWETGAKVCVTGRTCDVMAEATVKSSILETLWSGSYLLDFGPAAEPGWRNVALPDGREGFVRQEQVESEEEQARSWELLNEEERRNKLLMTAAKFLGTPYRWGGKTVQGIDCSGFTFMVYALNHIVIHRDSVWLPEKAVEKIADCERKPADLLYFPGHIALYLGNGDYLHSTARNGAGVTVNSLIPGANGFREDLYRSYLYTGSVF